MDSAVKTTLTQSPKPLGQLGRDEMNLAEFPIALLTDRVPKNQTEAIYQDELFDERTGRTLSRRLTIKAGGYGLTTSADDEVILALIQLTRQQNDFTDRVVSFSRLELIRLLGWPSHGASYDRILLSLQRWTSVYLQYDNAWRDNRTKTWTSPEGFHIIDNFKLEDSRNAGEQFDLLQSHIVWNEVIFHSFQAGYLKPLDYDLCTGLRNSTAKRMFRFLDKRFHHKPEWEFDLKEFAHEHIGLGRTYEGPAHLKRNLQPALTELESVGYLEALPESQRFQKVGKDWKIRLTQKAAPTAAIAAAPPADEPLPLVAELTKRGVTDDTAKTLVAEHPAEKIQTQIDVFDWLRDNKDKKVSRSPAGYLVKSITTGENGYAIPQGFVPAAQRRKDEASRKARQQLADEERRRKEESDAKARTEAKLVSAFWDGLSKEEAAKHEAIAIAQADAEELKLMEPGPMKRYGITIVRNNYARKLLQSEGKLPAAN